MVPLCGDTSKEPWSRKKAQESRLELIVFTRPHEVERSKSIFYAKIKLD